MLPLFTGSYKNIVQQTTQHIMTDTLRQSLVIICIISLRH